MRQPHVRRVLAALCVVVLLAAPLVPSLNACIDVEVLPGHSIDWLLGLPLPRLAPPLTPAPPAAGSGETLAPVVRPADRQGAPSTLYLTGITTWDIVSHYGNAVPERPVARTGDWPPAPPASLHWMALATLLRYYLHPHEVSDRTAIEQVIVLGESARPAMARIAEGFPLAATLTGMADDVARAIGPLDDGAPAPPGGGGVDGMLKRLATRELTASHPYDPHTPFAPRWRTLGATGLATVVALTESKHGLLRRNATAMLAEYAGPTAAARLRELLKSPDRVVRNRALFALGARREPASVAALGALLKGDDLGGAAVAAECLGRLGDPAAAPLLIAQIRARPDDSLMLWSAVPALARCARKGDKEALAVLREVRDACKGKPGRFKVHTPRKDMQPVTKPIMTRAGAIEQLALLGLARLGDKAAGKAIVRLPRVPDRKTQQRDADQALLTKLGWLLAPVIALKDKEREAAKAYSQLLPRRERLYKKLNPRTVGKKKSASLFKPHFPGKVLAKVAPVGRVLACEALAGQGKAGGAALMAIVADVTERPWLRARALDHVTLGRGARGNVWLRTLALDEAQVGPVVTRAMGRLELRDKRMAARVAKALVERYLATPACALPSRGDRSVIAAIELLGRAGAATVPLLTRVAAHAEKEIGYSRTLAARYAPSPERYAGGRYSLTRQDVSVTPVLRAAVVALARVPRHAGVPSLIARLGKADAQARGDAAEALGEVGKDNARAWKAAARALVLALKDRDGMLRARAYFALRARAGVDHGCDWIDGDAAARKAAVDRWIAWAKGL